MKYDLIISINVHENPDYLLNQIENINQYVSLKKKIILNCNDFMFNELKNSEIKNVVLNPVPLNKQRGHGSLTQGIVSNMYYALENYNFDYFLVMSSREFFYRELNNTEEIKEHSQEDKLNDYSIDTWHWPIFKNTKLFQYLRDKNLYYNYSAHEGMCFDKESCEYISNFLKDNSEITDDTFNFNHCVEEFALQSICCNFKPFYYIGNGVYEKSLEQLDKTKFTHKKIRSSVMNKSIELTADKNKALHKLKGLPPIYYINLDDQPERAQYMEDQFKYWGIENYERISAYDGRDGRDLGEILKGRYPDNMSSGEVGCVTSHLKVMKHWLETSDAPYVLIMEDDCDLSTVTHWPFNWKDFYAKVPYDYDVIQLAIINPAQVTLKLHKRFVNDFSTACYLITRHHAQKLISLHCRGDKYKIDNGVKPRAVADDLIYNSGNTFAIPLFLYKIELGSSIHDVHIDVFHRSSHDALWQFWKNQAPDIEDWNSIFDYDPYYGTLPPGFEGK